jgi:ankyrin repeat protein
MRNRLHKQNVDFRLSVDSQKAGKIVQAIFHAIKTQRPDLLQEAMGKVVPSKMMYDEYGDLRHGQTGYRLLTHAVGLNKVEMLKTLLNGGLRASAEDKDGRTALHFACYLGKTEMAVVLTQHCAKHWERDSRGFRPIDIAIKQGHIDTALQVLASSERGRDKWWRTTLDKACRSGYVELVKVLIKDGAMNPIIDGYSCTSPLEAAIEYGPPIITELLLAAGARLDLVSHRHFRRLKQNSDPVALGMRHTDYQCAAEKVHILRQYGLDWATLSSSSESGLAFPQDSDSYSA